MKQCQKASSPKLMWLNESSTFKDGIFTVTMTHCIPLQAAGGPGHSPVGLRVLKGRYSLNPNSVG